MFRASAALLDNGQYTSRLKTRMVGFIPKVNPRKIKNNMVALRSDANTGYFKGYMKTPEERMDNTGKKLRKVMYDEALQRFCVFQETKLKGPFITKAHIQRKLGDFGAPVGKK